MKNLAIYLLVLIVIHHSAIGQNAESNEPFVISGRITDPGGRSIPMATIAVEGSSAGSVSKTDGSYRLKIKTPGTYKLVYSCLGYQTKKVNIEAIPGKKISLDQTLQTAYQQLNTVNIRGDDFRTSTTSRLNTKSIEMLPSVSGNIESAITTYAGVSSRSELSSQYSVRGGNFDENLVYVNDVEIYRPFLIRSGQQEGLSFINPDLVSSVQFSAGGFEAFYGDKMSSVLDITYKKPKDYRASMTGSLLGGTAHLEGAGADGRFTHITGARYKTNQYLLSSLDLKGEYNPNFSDIQTYLTYDLSDQVEASFLGNFSRNQYNFIPEQREQAFGTTQNVFKLNIFYQGNEVDQFDTYTGAFTLNYQPSKQFSFRWITSAFGTRESETYDILGQYLINEADQSVDQFSGDSAANIGVGSFLNHARNYLEAYVLSTGVKGRYQTSNQIYQWGFNIQKEIIGDHIQEWELLDSSGYSLPYSDQEVLLNQSIYAQNSLNSIRLQSYINHSRIYDLGGNPLTINGGIRSTYWNLNQELLFSPRLTLSLQPLWKRDVLFRLSTGYYYQPPFYKEMRMPDGKINKNIRSQKSIHFVLGSDYNFMAWDRPFKLITEIYYKHFDHLIPYKIDNIRIRYAGENLARGFATGIDLKVNGEFVKGVESWASLSFMRTMEDIKNDFYIDEQGNRQEPGYYPRPTDQLVNFGLFFQDYLPNNPTYKMQLNLFYGHKLPYSPPHSDRYDTYFRMPSYKRVDIGLSKTFIDKPYGANRNNPLQGIKKLWVGLEIFNLFDNVNTISYLWVNTISSSERIPDVFAVPNYLTGRRLNLKLGMKF